MAKNKKITTLINESLKPIERGYRKAKKALKKARTKAPLLFHQIEGVLREHLISIESGKSMRKDPNFKIFSDTITEGIVKQIPYVDEKKLKEIVNDKSSNSFLDMITVGLGDTTQRDYTKLKKGKMFKKILIANRGEIALRVIRACRELGVASLQVYTKPDAKSLAVKFADEAVKLGNDASDYLDMKKIIAAAKKKNADAIHPGYGFLAENAEFAKLCKQNKIKFIGPSDKAILAMGDKINAKKIIKESGVPALEGTNKAIDSVSEGKSIASSIGFPVIIKASAGGGGRGMRIVQKEAEFEKAFLACQTEAENAFKNKDVFVEKYIENPRHIEFQILADRKGKVIHLGERDCSIQRRHQKLVEEAPSPAVDTALREKMGEAALKVASAIKYEGAGTVEFLLDSKKNFYFMEMNTRIQVEHGVTEMITGIDLVKEQIKIAAGAELSHTQNEVQIEGWAIECRINAECPYDDFCPETGVVVNYLPPGGPGIRVCSSCQQGQEVSPHYDSLLAKLMCHGKTRAEAIDRTKRALEEFIIEGIETTIPFHKAVLSNAAFAKGKVTTAFIEKEKIIDTVKREFNTRKKAMSKEEKAIVITTAVAEYMKKKNRFNDKQGAWVQAARQEAVFNE